MNEHEKSGIDPEIKKPIEKYQPTSEEIKKAEESMNIWQKNMSKSRDERGFWRKLYRDMTPDEMRKEIKDLEKAKESYKRSRDRYIEEERIETDPRSIKGSQNDQARVEKVIGDICDQIEKLKAEIIKLESE